MFTSQGPTLRELAEQALTSVERGYDLLAPKFDHTPFRTPDRFLDATAAVLSRLGPFDAGLDVCCGTGAGLRALRTVCRAQVTGVDFSAGMLATAADQDRTRRAAEPSERNGDPGPEVHWVRGDALALPFAGAFDLAVSFGAFGHFLPAERPALFASVHRALRPGGVFAFPMGAPSPVTSPLHWALLGFDTVMRVRNRLRRPPFVMYYRTFPLGEVRADLEAAGFAVELYPLEEFGRRPDGSPRCRLVVGRRRD
ncbi:class I SAM-dependent methyltransferase [Streptomyces boluensis]|uniref:Methyltransferase domain-containing protein n=1 Tax=Streptomyces boluensis TaxID=1775135 RepID=A0A964UQ44_9ACTN|nr:class I SAM-dependent methyltransferase [Streptomyces boluensis]NBE50972.1 methyltransferase domain-containing protein [Streptomyces boluensis]